MMKRTATSALLRAFLIVGPILGLRPIEWSTARVEGTQLSIRGAKTSNGRGLGKRAIDLAGWKEPARRDLARFLAALSKAGLLEHKRLFSRLNTALSRACKALGIAPICLYTLRHQALATMKRFQGAEVVAALAGHVTVRTAVTHYAKASGGWNCDPGVSATEETLARVRRGYVHSGDAAPVPSPENPSFDPQMQILV